MPHSFGYRARTRYMFQRSFKDHGMINLSTYMAPYKVRVGFHGFPPCVEGPSPLDTMAHLPRDEMIVKPDD